MRIHCLLFTLLLGACSPEPETKAETCTFNTTVLGYENASIRAVSSDNVLFEEMSHAAIPSLDITLQTSFSLDVPASVDFYVDGRRKENLRVRNCERLGVVLRKRPKGILLLHMDEYVFY